MIPSFTYRSYLPLAMLAWAMPAAVIPGLTTFTRMLDGPRHSFARMRAAWINAALGAAYDVEFGNSATACIVAVNTMAPPAPDACLRPAGARAKRMGPS